MMGNKNFKALFCSNNLASSICKLDSLKYCSTVLIVTFVDNCPASLWPSDDKKWFFIKFLITDLGHFSSHRVEYLSKFSFGIGLERLLREALHAFRFSLDKPVAHFRLRLRPGRRGRGRAGPRPGHEEEDTRGDHGWRGRAPARTVRCNPRGRICKQKLLVHFPLSLFHKFLDRH